jgi:hypothetical protein
MAGPILKALGLIGVLLTLSAGAIACGDGDGSVSVSGSGSASASGEPAGPGVVKPKPANATQLNVTLREWAIQLDQTSVKAGDIYFMVDNQGPEDPHEFVIIKSDLSPTSLPFENNKVPEDKVTIIDEIEPFTPKTKAADTFTLATGKYVLICNITEIEDGEVESHYKKGIVAALTVQ